eukprot:3667202-Rhodomonas_salina.1
MAFCVQTVRRMWLPGVGPLFGLHFTPFVPPIEMGGSPRTRCTPLKTRTSGRASERRRESERAKERARESERAKQRERARRHRP